MKHNESVTTVKRRRWIMRQKSRFFRLMQLPVAASIHCPFCRAQVAEGDYFCCPELEHAWDLTAKTTVVETILAGNHSQA